MEQLHTRTFYIFVKFDMFLTKHIQMYQNISC